MGKVAGNMLVKHELTVKLTGFVKQRYCMANDGLSSFETVTVV
jgi:hypothetical protein